MEPTPTSTERAAESTAHNRRRVRTDLVAGALLLGVVVGGNMIWHSPDVGILTVLGR
ncbi:hypothetical protein GEV29_02405 [Aeromicrobium sp. SMF47]|uniref:Uncharacterized protein n=1 Tax=Aeromicrobium yanjiei TaxID=2662028 RepID=A0A5Q2MC74_9ACTN|nr:hypothetical protein [Aeromicrobium yanjiei]MRJ75380.1 hypothetical protein [Aeromicrobium yanjiei]QGG40168.1 hypothetical protein GEV26_01590 [Aeromicrobium yanjiei]